MSIVVNLVTRFGGSAKNPSQSEIAQGIHDVFHEEDPTLVESDYAEHPNTWLTLGFQAGDKWTVHVLDLYRSGRMIFSKFEDQDDLDPMFEGFIDRVTEPEALRLWSLLAAGNIEALMREDWQRGQTKD